ncbi:hypothetical protein [Scytonema sp. NUACC26]|uniref:hypothetical protein n=1 Tax=Scytonema sp. NUACC26 TaxID=3140176 RepID=UPI0034DC70DB
MTQILSKLQEVPYQYATMVEVLLARSFKTPHTQAFTLILSTVQSLVTKETNQENLRWLTTDNLTQGIEDFWLERAINARLVECCNH